MRSGTCPKCGAQTIHTAHNGLGYEGSNPGIYVRTSMMTRASPMVDYVCAGCGAFERYIDDPDKLAEVAEKWDRVAPG